MDFALTEEQREIAAAARGYLGGTYSLERIAELADAGSAALDTWPELVRQGWLDPDLGPVELALLAIESGRALHPVPWLSATIVLPVYRAAGVELPGPATLASTRCRARRVDGTWALDGAAELIDGPTAVEIIVPATTPAGLALFGVRPGDPGVSLVQIEGIDPLRPIAELAMAGAPARLLVEAPSAEALLAAVQARKDMLLASEAVGVAERALEIAVEHATTRTQFDRPIGLFQGVSHPLADAYAEVELARSLCYRAAAGLEEEAVACAAHAGGRAAVVVCETAIQVCGGMGVTWEFALHRWYRRAMWLRAVLAESAPLPALSRLLFA